MVAAPPRGNPLAVMPTMASDLERVERELAAAARSQNPDLSEIASHLLAAGGKRIRPGFCIAAAATALSTAQPAMPEVVRGGVAIELVHLGSLYHDDVMDEAEMRRTVESVNARWGNHRAILAGDFLLARASEIAASLGVEVAGLLAATIGRLCEGQLLELQHAFDPQRSVADYLLAIEGKTAALLAAACRIGALVAELPRPHVDALTTFGRGYGMAFQIVDDVFDLVASSEELGKPSAHDVEEGVYTLPLILARDNGAGNQLAPLLTNPISDSARATVVEIVRSSGAIAASIAIARRHANEAATALDPLPPSPGVDGLRAAADHLLASVEAAAAPRAVA